HRHKVNVYKKHPITLNRRKAQRLESQHGSPETPKDRNRCYLSPHSAVLHQPASVHPTARQSAGLFRTKGRSARMIALSSPSRHSAEEYFRISGTIEPYVANACATRLDRCRRLVRKAAGPGSGRNLMGRA